MSRKFVRRGVKVGAIVGAVFFLAQVFLRKQAPKRTDHATRTPVSPKAGPETQGEERQAPGKVAAPEAPVPEAPAPAAPPEPTPEAPAPAAAPEPTPEAAAPAEGAAPSPPTEAAEAEAPSETEATGAGGEEASALPPWVDPEDGACPPTHPIKAKLSSKIFHAPGGLAYDRTTPDRCYRDAASAEADGFRPSKR